MDHRRQEKSLTISDYLNYLKIIKQLCDSEKIRGRMNKLEDNLMEKMKQLIEVKIKIIKKNSVASHENKIKETGN